MSNIQIIYVYKKIFCFYFEFPVTFDERTKTFYLTPRRKLLYSFYLTEFIIFIVGVVLIGLELFHIVHKGKDAKENILPILILLIANLGCAYDITFGLAIWRGTKEHVVFFNGLLKEADFLQRGEFALRRSRTRIYRYECVYQWKCVLRSTNHFRKLWIIFNTNNTYAYATHRR